MADDPAVSAPEETPAPPPEGPKKGKQKAAKPPKAAGANKLKEFVAALSPREKTFFKATALVLCLVIIDLVVIRPVSGFLRRLDDMIKVEEEVIPKKLQILKYKESVLREYSSLKPLLTDPKISQEEETAQFLREIERVSKEVNLFVSNINPVKVDKKSDEVYFLSVDIEGKGTIAAIRQFMRSLEASNPPMRVDSFALKPQGKESEDLKYSFSIVKIDVKEKLLNPAAL